MQDEWLTEGRYVGEKVGLTLGGQITAHQLLFVNSLFFSPK